LIRTWLIPTLFPLRTLRELRRVVNQLLQKRPT